jgi:hypothetical protein
MPGVGAKRVELGGGFGGGREAQMVFVLILDEIRYSLNQRRRQAGQAQ